MNKEEILAMEAGRELDFIVAVHVMNLCVLDNVQMYGDGCVMSDKGMDGWFKHPEYGKTADPDILEPYSSNISAAWEVEEKFKDIHLQKEYAIQLHNVLGLMLYEPTTLNNIYQFTHATPEQRCKAALLAVME